MDINVLNNIRASLSQAKVKLEEMRKDLENANRAGLDTTDLTRAYNEQFKIYQRMLMVYGG